MDKKQKKKIVPAICFVLICGGVYLGMHHGAQKKEQIVLEKQVETVALGEEVGEDVKPTSVVNPTGVKSNTEPVQAEVLYVHICGAVAQEGVYSLPIGSRLMDGVTAAGGFSEAADTTYHNLAAVLSDGQKVYVPTVEETRELSVTEKTEGAESMSDEGANGSVQKTATELRVNINTAGKEELMTLSGIGDAKAENILLYRTKVGPFQSIEELKNVSGIGDAMFERVKDSIIVE